MADERAEKIARIRAQVTQATIKEVGALVTRSEWGVIDFESGRLDLERTFALLEPLKTLPLEALPENILNQVEEVVRPVAQQIRAIDSFSLKVGNPTAERDQRVADLRGGADQLFSRVAPYIPYLAYHRGDIQGQLARLDAAVVQANNALAAAEKDITTKKADLDGIITEARNVAATAGAAVFVQDFETEAVELNKSAAWWLGATGGFAALAFVVAVLSFLLMPDAAANVPYVIQYTVAKVFALAILIAGAFWTGSIYRAVKHQATTNRHRANGLKTFQAFLKAASDEPTRNAVLLETTRSIFAVTPTGYLSATETNADSGLKAADALKLAKG